MKRLILSAVFFFSVSTAYADVISVPAFSADSGVSHLETFRTTVVNAINGNIEGAGSTGAAKNIKADTVSEIEMYDDANPRIRDGELLGIGSDSVSSGSLVQSSYVYSGGVPADDTDLTSDISAIVVYINGYRITKGATALTYTANRDNYVDISQTGSYTVSPVTIGAAAPSVAANSARLAKVVTDGTEIQTITDLARRSLSGLVVPTNFRDGLVVSKDSTTTIRILPGIAEINGSMVEKTTGTTLTISTAGDWAGGTSLRAANTYGFVGLDSSGNLKLHTTAPAYDNYDLTSTAGKKRYASWSSTTYRQLGWFYMDAAQVIENASNIREAGLSNIIQSNDTAIVSVTGTAYTERQKTNFYSSGGVIRLQGVMSIDVGVTDGLSIEFGRASAVIPGSGNSSASSNAGNLTGVSSVYLDLNRPQGTTSYSVYSKLISGTINANRRELVVEEV